MCDQVDCTDDGKEGYKAGYDEPDEGGDCLHSGLKHWTWTETDWMKD